MSASLSLLTYITATSRVLAHPINILIKGVSGGGKSFTALHTLELVGQDFVNQLTSSSALSFGLRHSSTCSHSDASLRSKSDAGG